jgi:hypothetical protein
VSAKTVRHFPAGVGTVRGTMRAVKGRDGYWELAVEDGRDPLTGRRTRVVQGFRGTKRQAEAALNELVTEVSAGRASTVSVTFRDLLDRWLDNVGASLSPTTSAEYRRLVDRRIGPALGSLEVAKPATAGLRLTSR